MYSLSSGAAVLMQVPARTHKSRQLDILTVVQHPGGEKHYEISWQSCGKPGPKRGYGLPVPLESPALTNPGRGLPDETPAFVAGSHSHRIPGMATVPSFAQHIKKGVPMIGVPDVVAAIDWYVALGFTEVGRFDDEGEVNFGMVAFGDAELMFNLYMPPAPDGVSLWLRTDRIDAIYDTLQTRRRPTTASAATPSDGDAPLDIEQNIEDMFYGARQFAIRDLNGYSVYFIQPLERA